MLHVARWLFPLSILVIAPEMQNGFRYGSADPKDKNAAWWLCTPYITTERFILRRFLDLTGTYSHCKTNTMHLLSANHVPRICSNVSRPAQPELAAAPECSICGAARLWLKAAATLKLELGRPC